MENRLHDKVPSFTQGNRGQEFWNLYYVIFNNFQLSLSNEKVIIIIELQLCKRFAFKSVCLFQENSVTSLLFSGDITVNADEGSSKQTKCLSSKGHPKPHGEHWSTCLPSSFSTVSSLPFQIHTTDNCYFKRCPNKAAGQEWSCHWIPLLLPADESQEITLQPIVSLIVFI